MQFKMYIIMGNAQQIIINFFIKKLLSCCLIEIDSYIQQLRNGADIPFLLILSEYLIASLNTTWPPSSLT